MADIQPIQVMWKMDDRELIQSERIEMSFMQDTGVARLVIRKPSQPDYGEYTCVAIGEMFETQTGRRVSKTIMSSSTVLVEGKLTFTCITCNSKLKLTLYINLVY
ncbi:unnamed protein product [Protopolystoma xenopodis]|uniref:Ig-like domain-containing protein n=1 Tax=Protopolystoma xenopodis TaxID=117903 RepID=A0A3S5FEZ5_9PLAT|nr:unnamed protein product [Protopolystoma xenopodis]